MADFFRKLFDADFMPHVLCLRQPDVIWLHVASDALIAFAYLLIPVALLRLTQRRPDLSFNWLLLLFGVFILSCGATHAFGIVTLWTPIYRFEGLLKLFTAGSSLLTAVVLIRVLPEIAHMPSLSVWRKSNEQLKQEVQRSGELQAALTEVAERLDLALHFANVAVWTWKVTLGTVDWSGPVNSVFGASANQLHTYQSFKDMIFPKDRDGVGERMANAISTRGLFKAEFRVVRPDGQIRWIAGVGGALVNSKGDVSSMAGVFYDVSEEKSAAARLAISERHFRVLAEAMPLIVWTANSEGEYEYYNSAWYRVSGHSPAEKIEQDRGKVLHPDDQEIWKRAWQSSLSSGARYEVEYRFWDAERQEYRWYIGRAVPAKDPEDGMVRWFGTCTDIHERKMAEIQLKESEEALRTRDKQLAAIFDTGIVGDFYWDILTDTVVAHPAMWQVWGGSADQTTAPVSWFANRYYPADSERVSRDFEAALRGERPLDLEYRIVCPDGSIRWLATIGAVIRDSSGHPIGTKGLNIDMTARKLAEIKALESDRRLRQQADAMPQIVWSATAKGEIDHYNRRWYEYTGDSPESLPASAWKRFVHPDDLDGSTRRFEEGFAGRSGFEINFRIRRIDGTYLWHLTRCEPFTDEEGNLSSWFGTSTDVHEQRTEQDRLEEEIQLRTEALRRSLNEKETLLKEVHHRVKNNLQVISSLLSMQADSLQDPGANYALRESQQRVVSMAMIHERLYGNNQMNAIDFGEYADTLVRELFHSYDNHHGKVVSRIETSPVLLGIDQAIPAGLILNELVTNALKYAYPNGATGQVFVGLHETDGGAVSLTVSDGGVGMPDGFDWKKSKSLGLPIVDILSRQIGGKLTVLSQAGATFRVDFVKDDPGGVHKSSTDGVPVTA